MRKRADWMTRTDDEILEFLRDSNFASPQLIADTIGRNNDYVGQRCRKLLEYGLLTRPSKGIYAITDDGERYLDEQLDANDLNPNGSSD